ncbi:hypothetical protein GQ600_26190 [Phytophthora cactorum]|nr:hypothetical protein GQ600_26190 [Phytophthora cactorum]
MACNVTRKIVTLCSDGIYAVAPCIASEVSMTTAPVVIYDCAACNVVTPGGDKREFGLTLEKRRALSESDPDVGGDSRCTHSSSCALRVTKKPTEQPRATKERETAFYSPASVNKKSRVADSKMARSESRELESLIARSLTLQSLGEAELESCAGAPGAGGQLYHLNPDLVPDDQCIGLCPACAADPKRLNSVLHLITTTGARATFPISRCCKKVYCTRPFFQVGDYRVRQARKWPLDLLSFERPCGVLESVTVHIH